MQTTNITKKLSLFLCSVLIAATALFATGCSDTNTSSEAISSSSTASTVSSSSSEASDVSSNVSSDASSNSNVLGEGKSQFTLTVTDKDGKEESFEIHTDKTTVGDALVETGNDRRRRQRIWPFMSRPLTALPQIMIKTACIGPFISMGKCILRCGFH